MLESSLDLVQQFAKEKEEIHQKIEAALDTEFQGIWTKDGNLDHTAIISALSKYVTPNEKGLLEHPAWIVSVRNPHLYKNLIDTAFSSLYKRYGTTLSANQIARKNQLRVAEEQLHSVPTLGKEAVLDRIFGAAFLYDTSSRRHIVHPFFTYNDPTDNYELLIEVVETPHRVLGTNPEGIDQNMLETARQKSN